MVIRTVVEPNAVLLDKLLAASGASNILIGGQALAFWIAHYKIRGLTSRNHPVITLDTDFLARAADDLDSVKLFASAIGGKAVFAPPTALTSLIGQAELSVSETEYINVDVIFKVFGLKADAVRKRAIKVTSNDFSVLIMHPLHVLRSRLQNLYKLKDKQNEKGASQLMLSIEVARVFIQKQHKLLSGEGNSNRSPLQPFVSEIEKMALDDAGRKVAARWGVHVADAIDPGLIPAGAFWDKKWPSLKLLMSEAYASQVHVPEPSSTPIERMRD